MATHIIIDGYNLIGTRDGMGGDLETKREELIRRLIAYRKVRKHPITLVFDGWQSGGITERKKMIGGITVIFSRHGEKADALIQRLASREGSRCIVVSSDREVQEGAVSGGGTAITSGEFEERMMMTSLLIEKGIDAEEESERPSFTTKKKGNPRRLSKSERKKRKKLKKL